jgi:hypothetical protein
MYGCVKLSQDSGKDDNCDLELDLQDLEVTLVNQIEVLPVLFEGCKVITDVIFLFSSGMPGVSNDSNSSLLAFVLIDCLEVMPGCVRRSMLYVNERFISDILGNKVLSIIVIIPPIVMPNQILLLFQLKDFPQDVQLNFT